jgi:hypothetical protein
MGPYLPVPVCTYLSIELHTNSSMVRTVRVLVHM